ncbi:ABC transporter transmembrane domain-containing protein [Geomicrobium sp. JCM 19055]|uniref:ABC transporter transmembrane domain-containing protein n=1 Tax=Geomicrobium sp. JCM 19055 TaxID=1460649 RepID=UPI0026D84961
MSEKKRTIKDFYHLFQQYRPRMWIVIVAIALVIGESLLSLIVPLITMNIVNAMVVEGFQLQIIATLVVVFVAQIILSGVSLYMMIYVGETIVARLRTTLWNKILYLPIQFFDQHSSGETMSRVTNDTNVIKDFFTMQLIPFFFELYIDYRFCHFTFCDRLENGASSCPLFTVSDARHLTIR